MRKKRSDCAECGQSFESERREARFCSSDCRLAFNRRRRDRGAELYDFVMAKDTKIVSALTEAYRTADAEIRAGRPSWQNRELALFKIPSAFGHLGDKR